MIEVLKTISLIIGLITMMFIDYVLYLLNVRSVGKIPALVIAISIPLISIILAVILTIKENKHEAEQDNEKSQADA